MEPIQKKPTTAERAEVKRMIDQYLRSIVFDNEAENLADIMGIVENPFVDRGDNDAISLIFHRFLKHTSVHPGLPIFCFLGLLSAWCVQQKTRCRIPMTKHATELDTWVLVLGNTGANKSTSLKTIISALPKNPENGQPVVHPNFVQPASNAAYIDQLAKLPDHRGFWQQDEASQFIKQIDGLTGPLASIKQSILITKDHGTLDYATKTGGTVRINEPVLTVLMLNTIGAMKKAFSEDSMLDGTFRRFTVAMAESKEDLGGLEFHDTALFNLAAITDGTLEREFVSVFNQDVMDKTYTFSDACVPLYQEAFKAMWLRQFKKFLSEHETYFRTYMMEAWRYAVFHHIIHKKTGFEVDEYSLQWGLRVSLFLLTSLQNFLSYAARREDVAAEADTLTKMMNFIRENENKANFGMRAVCRKFNMKKADVLSYLYAIRTHDKKFKTKLFEDLKKHEEKRAA